MKEVGMASALFIMIILLAGCSEGVSLMEEEKEEESMDTTELDVIEPIGLDTNSLTPCYSDALGPFKSGICRLRVVYGVSESRDPETGEVTVNNIDTFNYRYNESGQLIYHEGIGFRDSITYHPDGTIYQVIRMDYYNDYLPPDLATYYYHPGGAISHIHYDKWYGTGRVDSFYYDDNLNLSGIQQWSLNDDGSVRGMLYDYSYDYYDKGLMRRVKEVSYECTDYCNAPYTTFLYFWNYTDLKFTQETAGFYHYTKIHYDRLFLNVWNYAYTPDYSYYNSGQEGDLSEIEYNEYGYMTSRYYELECFE